MSAVQIKMWFWYVGVVIIAAFITGMFFSYQYVFPVFHSYVALKLAEPASTLLAYLMTFGVVTVIFIILAVTAFLGFRRSGNRVSERRFSGA